MLSFVQLKKRKELRRRRGRRSKKKEKAEKEKEKEEEEEEEDEEEKEEDFPFVILFFFILIISHDEEVHSNFFQEFPVTEYPSCWHCLSLIANVWKVDLFSRKIIEVSQSSSGIE